MTDPSDPTQTDDVLEDIDAVTGDDAPEPEPPDDDDDAE